MFFLPQNAAQLSDVLAYLRAKSGYSGLDVWPVIKEETHTVAITGGRSSTRTSTERAFSLSRSQLSSSGSDSVDEDRGTSANSIVIPRSIHPAITISNPTNGAFTVHPTVIPATAMTVFPTGKRLVNLEVSLDAHGYCRVIAITVDITSGMV
jgi:hypothetical protein